MKTITKTRTQQSLVQCGRRPDEKIAGQDHERDGRNAGDGDSDCRHAETSASKCEIRCSPHAGHCHNQGTVGSTDVSQSASPVRDCEQIADLLANSTRVRGFECERKLAQDFAGWACERKTNYRELTVVVDFNGMHIVQGESAFDKLAQLLTRRITEEPTVVNVQCSGHPMDARSRGLYVRRHDADWSVATEPKRLIRPRPS